MSNEIGVRAVERAIAILDVLAQGGSRTGAEIARELHVHRSTALRLLGTLERHAREARGARRGGGTARGGADARGARGRPRRDRGPRLWRGRRGRRGAGRIGTVPSPSQPSRSGPADARGSGGSVPPSRLPRQTP